MRDLKDQFTIELQQAEAKANELLDGFLSEGEDPMIVPLDLSLKNREIRSEEDIDALVEEIRERLLEQLRSGQRVRLL